MGRVPNVPCGVESYGRVGIVQHYIKVPNVPCGVESFVLVYLLRSSFAFLMYRVELKELFCFLNTPVPRLLFLMYRVELKAK